MFDPFTLALLGGAAGGLLNKKDPLTGALMGAGLGYTGGALSGGGGLLGSSSAAALPGANTAAELAAAQGSLAPGSAALLEKPASLLTQAKPFMEATSTGLQVANAFQDKPQAPITPSPITPPTFNNAAGQMVAGMQQQQAERMAAEQQRRMQRRQMRGLL